MKIHRHRQSNIKNPKWKKYEKAPRITMHKIKRFFTWNRVKIRIASEKFCPIDMTHTQKKKYKSMKVFGKVWQCWDALTTDVSKGMHHARREDKKVLPEGFQLQAHGGPVESLVPTQSYSMSAITKIYNDKKRR